MGKSKKKTEYGSKGCTFTQDGLKCEDECEVCPFEGIGPVEQEPLLLMVEEEEIQPMLEIEPAPEPVEKPKSEVVLGAKKGQTASQTELKSQLIMKGHSGKMSQKYCQYRTRYN